MIAIKNKNLWERLSFEEELLFKDLLPLLLDTSKYKRNLKRLVQAIYKKSLVLFPDIEKEILPDSSSTHSNSVRFRDPLSIYLNEVKGFGVSNREEENLLARALEIARLTLNQEIAALPGIRKSAENLTHTQIPQIPELIEHARQENSESGINPKALKQKVEKIQQRLEEFNRIRSILISKNLHLVPSFARRYRNLGVPYQDLIQEGNASLLRAADKFDWKRGVRFSTYAQWWINQAMLKSLYSQSRVVRLPVYLNQKMKKVRDANQESWSERGQDMTPEQMAKNLKEPLSRIRRAMRANVGTFSLDQENSGSEDYSLRELLVAPKTESVSDLPEGPGLKERIESVLKTLPEKERKILVLRYGLEGNTPHTLDEVSKFYRVSRERIRQIQVQALKKLLIESKKVQLNSFLS